MLKVIRHLHTWNIFLISILFNLSNVFAQSGIVVDSTGFNPKPTSSAVLDISSKTKGVLFPRMSISQRTNIPSPEKGLTVYQTEEPDAGIWIFNGTDWEPNLSNLPGPQGDIGLTGDPGPAGQQGIKGDIGLTGLQGPKGDKGDTGPAGTPYVAPYSWGFGGYSTEGEAFMQIDGINGKSRYDIAPPGSIDIEGYTFGDGMKTSMGFAGANSSHVVPYAEISIYFGYSMAIPTIFQKHFRGDVIPELSISKIKPIGLARNPKIVYKIDLKNVVIMQIKTVTQSNELEENVVTFRYNAIRQTYTNYSDIQRPYDVTMSWNHETGTPTY